MLVAYTPQSFAQKGNKKDLENKKKKLKEGDFKLPIVATISVCIF